MLETKKENLKWVKLYLQKETLATKCVILKTRTPPIYLRILDVVTPLLISKTFKKKRKVFVGSWAFIFQKESFE